MNKHEIKSAYNKIALSDEFRAEAKEKLLSCFDEDNTAAEEAQEIHTAKSIKLTSQPKKPWKAVAGVCTAAAVVGLGVWGVSAVIGRDMPVDDPSDVVSQSDSTSSSVTIIEPDIQDSSDTEKQSRIERYDTDNPVIVFEDVLRNGDSEYDFRAYIYQIMSETEDAYRGNCAIEISENGEIADRNMLLVGYTLGQNGTEFRKDGDDGYFSVIELKNGSVLLSTREDEEVTQATLYTVKDGEIAQIERYFEDPSDRPERDSSIRSFNLSRSYTTEKDDIIFNIGGEEVRVTIDFDELTLKCEEGFESVVYNCGDAEDDYQNTVNQNYGEVRKFFDHYLTDSILWDEEKDFYIEGLPEVRFVCTSEEVRAIDTSGNEEVLFGGMPIWSIYLTDLNGDGIREICSGVSIGSGIVDDHIVAYDYAAKKIYELSDRGYNDYYLSYSGLTPLMAHERDYATGELTGYCGRLMLDGDTLTFEWGGDINTAEMKRYSLPMNGAEVQFSLPSSWESSASTASYADIKVFEIGPPWSASEGIDTDSYKTDEAYRAEITVLHEKWGTDSDLYEYFIHTSTPIKYAPDGTYDVYRYVVESGGCYITVSVVSDMGVKQQTIDRVLESVKITADGGTEAESDEKDINYTGAYQVYEDKGEVFHIEEMNGGTHAASNEDIRNVQLRFALPYYWVYEPSDYFSGKAYFDGDKIFEYERPLHDDEPINPDRFKTDYVDGDKVTVHEEKWGTDSDLFEYYIHTSTESKDADDGSFDEYVYIVNDNGYNITLTFAADFGLEQETIDMILEMVQIRSADLLFYDKTIDINYTDTMLRYRETEQVGESRFDEYESEWVDYLQLEIELPFGWRVDKGSYSIDGIAYYNDREIFRYDRPIKASEGIDTAALTAGTTEGEEKYGTDGDMFEYRLITPDKYVYVVNSGDYNITLTFDANAGLSQETIDKVVGSVYMYEYEYCLDAIDGYFPIGDVWAFIHNGAEYRQDILTYRFMMDKYGNILEGEKDNYNNFNDYINELNNSTYIGAAEGLCGIDVDVRYYLINGDVILGILPVGDELQQYVDSEELLALYDADEIFHGYIYKRIKG